MNGDAIAILDRQNEEDEIVVLPVPDLTELLMEKMADCPTVSVHFDHHVSDVGTLDQKAWVDLEITGKKVERMFADFVVGCDGGKSDVRKSLLGHSFPGYTWQEQIIATDVCVLRLFESSRSSLAHHINIDHLRPRKVWLV